LRSDNADLRLTPKGETAGCVGPERRACFGRKRDAVMAARALAHRLRASPNELGRHGLAINQDGVVRSAWDLLAYATLDLARLAAVWPELAELEPDVAEQLAIEGKYAGYLERQDSDIRAYRREEGMAIPADLDYDLLGSLSTEVRQKLKAARPETLAAAARIPGITPAAVTALLMHVKRGG